MCVGIGIKRVLGRKLLLGPLKRRGLFPKYAVAIFIEIASLMLCSAPRVKAQAPTSSHRSNIGREVAIPQHLRDDEEFSLPPKELLEYGKKLSMANWTEEEGAGRP